MQQVYVSLPCASQVQRFVKTLTPLDGDFEFVADPYVLDARSLMGVFSLDLTHPVLLKIYNETPENLQALEPFLTSGRES